MILMMEMDDETRHVQKLCCNNSHSFGCDFDLTGTSGQLNRQGEKRTHPVARRQRKTVIRCLTLQESDMEKESLYRRICRIVKPEDRCVHLQPTVSLMGFAQSGTSVP